MSDIEDALTAVQHLEDDRTGNHLSDEEHIAATTAIRKALQEPEYEWGLTSGGATWVAWDKETAEAGVTAKSDLNPEAHVVRRIKAGPWEKA